MMINRERLFVFSNTYTVRVLLKCLDCVEAKEEVEVILLSEYGVSEDIDLDIFVCDSLPQCIKVCTKVLIVCDYTIPQRKIDYIKSSAKQQGKTCVVVNNFDEEKKSNRSASIPHNYKDTPRLLFITDGNRVQISCWELCIYKILREKNISVISALSNELRCIVNWLSLCNIKCDLLDELLNFKSDCMGLIMQFSGSLSNITRQYLNLSMLSLRVQELIKFMNIPLKNHKMGEITPVFDSDSVIEFKNVSFRYPGSDRLVIDKLNLTVRGDEKLCIVGVNGSGKSTFVKLLTRLYVPTDGEILLNGININEYDYREYCKLFAPVFQDFALYNITLGENIVMAEEYNRERLLSATRQSGLSAMVENTKYGYDTIIYKWFDEEGVEPSGGEGQRIAMARALYRGGSVYILDEPTAALDPNAEYEIYTQFNNMITDKCAVLITHRLSAVQLADMVAVFDDGHVAEYGTHAELYAKGGIYTEMFDKQAKFYRDKPTESDGDEECE